jgi:hypothetical protein
MGRMETQIIISDLSIVSGYFMLNLKKGKLDRMDSENQAYRYRRPRGGARYPIRPIVSRITRAHWPSFYNVVTGKTLALPNLIALQHIPLSPAGVIAKRPAPIALPNSCAA